MAVIAGARAAVGSLPAATYRPILTAPGTQQITAFPCILAGWGLSESTEVTDCELDLWDGNPAAGGRFLGTVQFGAGGCSFIWLGEEGFEITAALYIVNSFGAPAGNGEGSLFTVP